MDIRVTLKEALSLHQQRKFEEAEKRYRTILQHQPLNSIALHHLGLIAGEFGHVEPALDLVAQSLKLDPTNVAYRVNQVGLLDRAGKRDQAIDAARKLVADRPEELRIRSDFARLLLKYGEFKLAAEEWKLLQERAPSDVAVNFHCAYSLEMSGEQGLAESYYRKTIELQPEYGEPMVNLAGICLRSGRIEEGMQLLERAVELIPEHPIALSTLGLAHTKRGMLEDGLVSLKKALSVAPENTDVLRNLGFAHLIRGEIETAVSLYERAISIDPTLIEANSDLLMARLYLDSDPMDELAAHRQYQQRVATVINANPASPRKIEPGERLRIGYVSPDFMIHPVGHFIEPLLAHHDRERFEIHCFHDSASSDELTERIKVSVDVFHKVHAMTLNQLDAYIRKTQIDILIDLAGHTGSNRLAVFAHKPAPLQVSYLGYPNTTGLDAMDLRITDAIADPPGFADTIHTERLCRLPQSFGLFRPIQDAPEVRPTAMLSNGYVTFGTMGRIEKWTRPMLASWARILDAVPRSRFRVIGRGYTDTRFRAQLNDRLQDAGFDPARLDMVGRVPMHEYLAELSNFDILLDTLPFNGHTTTLQALFMGIPTVTLPGKVHRSRMGASLLSTLHLDELIATSRDEYEQIAIELARDADRLSNLHKTLRDRLLQSSLCDGPRFARAFEACLLEAWQRISKAI